MNFLAILKQIFRTRPSLDEFISIHNPQSTADVERLERDYERLVAHSSFFT